MAALLAAGCFVGGYEMRGPTARATPIDPDTAPQIARSFAPWIRAMIQQRANVADQIFVTPKYIFAAFGSDTGKQILARFNGNQQHDLNLIGAKNLGRNMGAVLFTISTADGPVALKIYYYGYNAQLHISRIELADDWPDIERLDLEMDALTEPTTIPLMGQATDQ
ncbi:MAG TPA: hypothetical protein VHQ47_13415 [Phycisphaerae bacterium]|jgi:hypothetical protein|nr:hypothetical protein [Phycisphaerae bacterium]